jgi:hypothetical protein
MKDTLLKLRALLNMKSHLLEQALKDREFAENVVQVLRADLEHAVSLITRRDRIIKELQDENYKLRMKEWEQQDKDEEWLADYLARDEGLSLAEQRERDEVDEHGNVISKRMTVLDLMDDETTEDTDEDYEYEDIPF